MKNIINILITILLSSFSNLNAQSNIFHEKIDGNWVLDKIYDREIKEFVHIDKMKELPELLFDCISEDNVCHMRSFITKNNTLRELIRKGILINETQNTFEINWETSRREFNSKTGENEFQTYTHKYSYVLKENSLTLTINTEPGLEFYYTRKTTSKPTISAVDDIKEELQMILNNTKYCLGGVTSDDDISISTQFQIIDIIPSKDKTEFTARVFQSCIVEKLKRDKNGVKQRGRRRPIKGYVNLRVVYKNNAIQNVFHKDNTGVIAQIYPAFKF